MKKHAFNPYLPHWEFVPDGEPHVFGDRLYLYGSHDVRNGTSFCQDDYVVWSAPVDDLSDWRCEGVSYRKDQDPLNGAPYDGVLPRIDMPLGTPENPHLLYAPDVAQGPDGRYYLYYSLDFTSVISVAVSDTPAGPFRFLDFVRTADGEIPKSAGNWFDPAILCEESGNYLYFGFCPTFRFPGMEDTVFPGAMMVRLADDMHTVISEPVCVAHGVDTAKGTSYEGHPFFEASSIRKIGGLYYFVYSSLQGNELCYGTAATPEGPFEFKGVLHSNGDLGYRGSTQRVTYTGNNHGGLVQIGDDVYIFGHRHTHGTAFNRQGVAEKVTVLPDGTIPQAEITSCGLNGGPLEAKGTHPAYIACHLTEKDLSRVGDVLLPQPGEPMPELPESVPYITEEAHPDWEKQLKPYIANLREGAVAGFKYFRFDGTEQTLSLELRGCGSVCLRLDSPTGAPAALLAHSSEGWEVTCAALARTVGDHALYITVTEGTLDLASFRIS